MKAALVLVPVQLDVETGIGVIIIVLSIILLIVIINSTIEIVGPAEQGVLTVFGRYRRLLKPGVNVVIPLISEAHSVNVGMQELKLTDQTAITRDDFVVTVDIGLFVQVTDAKKATLEVDDYEQKVSTQTVKTLREILENMDMEKVSESHEKLGVRIEQALRRSAADWGVQVLRVNIDSVEPATGT